MRDESKRRVRSVREKPSVPIANNPVPKQLDVTPAAGISGVTHGIDVVGG